MFHVVIQELIRDCVAQALGVPRDEVSNELRDIALASVNENAQIIWFQWKWDAEKIDEFQTPTHDANGIITFGSNVESIMAVKKVDTTSGSNASTYIWPQDIYNAAAQGLTSIDTDRFDHAGADSSGNRRILVPVPSTGTDTYRVLALSKYTRVIVDPAYDSNDPTATPTDYRVMQFPLDRAEPALRAAVKDSLRAFQRIPREKNFNKLLRMALKRETFDNAKERRSDPKSPMYSEVGNWEGDG